VRANRRSTECESEGYRGGGLSGMIDSATERASQLWVAMTLRREDRIRLIGPLAHDCFPSLQALRICTFLCPRCARYFKTFAS
jgi:hypothetical protein